ncbi:hypothetical protein ACHAWX_003363, partial [Stephanocyclus meneghinianus]
RSASEILFRYIFSSVNAVTTSRLLLVKVKVSWVFITRSFNNRSFTKKTISRVRYIWLIVSQSWIGHVPKVTLNMGCQSPRSDPQLPTPTFLVT